MQLIPFLRVKVRVWVGLEVDHTTPLCPCNAKQSQDTYSTECKYCKQVTDSMIVR